MPAFGISICLVVLVFLSGESHLATKLEVDRLMRLTPVSAVQVEGTYANPSRLPIGLDANDTLNMAAFGLS